MQAERAGVALLPESPGLDSILPIEGTGRGEESYVESMRQEKETGWLMENGGNGGCGIDRSGGGVGIKAGPGGEVGIRSAVYFLPMKRHWLMNK